MCAATIAVLLSGTGGGYDEVVDAITLEVHRAGNHRILTAVVDTPGAEEVNQAQMLIAVGTRAARSAIRSADPKLPVLSVLLPRSAYEAIVTTARSSDARRSSAIYLDQPMSRQVELMRAIMPNASRLSVLAGPGSQGDLDRLRAAADSRNIRITAERIARESELFPALQRVMTGADAFLALPDSRVINAQTAQNLLLTGFRQRVPVIGYSASYVRAGALAAVYVTPAQTGAQAGEIARQYLRNGVLPAPVYSRQIAVAVNHNVAKALGLSLNENTLRDKILRSEQ